MDKSLFDRITGETNIFISYARKDGAAFCERLYQQLSAGGIAAWRDLRDLDPYAGFDAEIEAAIEHATHLVAIITPDLKREDSFVRLEIAYALFHNKPIIPLLFYNEIIVSGGFLSKTSIRFFLTFPHLLL